MGEYLPHPSATQHTNPLFKLDAVRSRVLMRWDRCNPYASQYAPPAAWRPTLWAGCNAPAGAGAGAVCDAVAGPACLPGMACLDGVCVHSPGLLGDACDAAHPCLAGAYVCDVAGSQRCIEDPCAEYATVTEQFDDGGQCNQFMDLGSGADCVPWGDAECDLQDIIADEVLVCINQGFEYAGATPGEPCDVDTCRRAARTDECVRCQPGLDLVYGACYRPDGSQPGVLIPPVPRMGSAECDGASLGPAPAHVLDRALTELHEAAAMLSPAVHDSLGWLHDWDVGTDHLVPVLDHLATLTPAGILANANVSANLCLHTRNALPRLLLELTVTVPVPAVLALDRAPCATAAEATLSSTYQLAASTRLLFEFASPSATVATMLDRRARLDLTAAQELTVTQDVFGTPAAFLGTMATEVTCLRHPGAATLACRGTQETALRSGAALHSGQLFPWLTCAHPTALADPPRALELDLNAGDAQVASALPTADMAAVLDAELKRQANDLPCTAADCLEDVATGLSLSFARQAALERLGAVGLTLPPFAARLQSLGSTSLATDCTITRAGLMRSYMACMRLWLVDPSPTAVLYNVQLTLQLQTAQRALQLHVLASLRLPAEPLGDHVGDVMPVLRLMGEVGPTMFPTATNAQMRLPSRFQPTRTSWVLQGVLDTTVGLSFLTGGRRDAPPQFFARANAGTRLESLATIGPDFSEHLAYGTHTFSVSQGLVDIALEVQAAATVPCTGSSLAEVAARVITACPTTPRTAVPVRAYLPTVFSFSRSSLLSPIVVLHGSNLLTETINATLDFGLLDFAKPEGEMSTIEQLLRYSVQACLDTTLRLSMPLPPTGADDASDPGSARAIFGLLPPAVAEEMQLHEALTEYQLVFAAWSACRDPASRRVTLCPTLAARLRGALDLPPAAPLRLTVPDTARHLAALFGVDCSRGCPPNLLDLLFPPQPTLLGAFHYVRARVPIVARLDSVVDRDAAGNLVVFTNAALEFEANDADASAPQAAPFFSVLAELLSQAGHHEDVYGLFFAGNPSPYVPTLENSEAWLAATTFGLTTRCEVAPTMAFNDQAAVGIQPFASDTAFVANVQVDVLEAAVLARWEGLNDPRLPFGVANYSLDIVNASGVLNLAYDLASPINWTAASTPINVSSLPRSSADVRLPTGLQPANADRDLLELLPPDARRVLIIVRNADMHDDWTGTQVILPLLELGRCSATRELDPLYFNITADLLTALNQALVFVDAALGAQVLTVLGAPIIMTDLVSPPAALPDLVLADMLALLTGSEAITAEHLNNVTAGTGLHVCLSRTSDGDLALRAFVDLRVDTTLATNLSTLPLPAVPAVDLPDTLHTMDATGVLHLELLLEAPNTQSDTQITLPTFPVNASVAECPEGEWFPPIESAELLLVTAPPGDWSWQGDAGTTSPLLACPPADVGVDDDVQQAMLTVANAAPDANLYLLLTLDLEELHNYWVFNVSLAPATGLDLNFTGSCAGPVVGTALNAFSTPRPMSSLPGEPNSLVLVRQFGDEFARLLVAPGCALTVTSVLAETRSDLTQARGTVERAAAYLIGSQDHDLTATLANRTMQLLGDVVLEEAGAALAWPPTAPAAEFFANLSGAVPGLLPTGEVQVDLCLVPTEAPLLVPLQLPHTSIHAVDPNVLDTTVPPAWFDFDVAPLRDALLTTLEMAGHLRMDLTRFTPQLSVARMDLSDLFGPWLDHVRALRPALNSYINLFPRFAGPASVSNTCPGRPHPTLLGAAAALEAALPAASSALHMAVTTHVTSTEVGLRLQVTAQQLDASMPEARVRLCTLLALAADRLYREHDLSNATTVPCANTTALDSEMSLILTIGVRRRHLVANLMGDALTENAFLRVEPGTRLSAALRLGVLDTPINAASDLGTIESFAGSYARVLAYGVLPAAAPTPAPETVPVVTVAAYRQHGLASVLQYLRNLSFRAVGTADAALAVRRSQLLNLDPVVLVAVSELFNHRVRPRVFMDVDLSSFSLTAPELPGGSILGAALTQAMQAAIDLGTAHLENLFNQLDSSIPLVGALQLYAQAYNTSAAQHWAWGCEQDDFYAPFAPNWAANVPLPERCQGRMAAQLQAAAGLGLGTTSAQLLAATAVGVDAPADAVPANTPLPRWLHVTARGLTEMPTLENMLKFVARRLPPATVTLFNLITFEFRASYGGHILCADIDARLRYSLDSLAPGSGALTDVDAMLQHLLAPMKNVSEVQQMVPALGSASGFTAVLGDLLAALELDLTMDAASKLCINFDTRDLTHELEFFDASVTASLNGLSLNILDIVNVTNAQASVLLGVHHTNGSTVPRGNFSMDLPFVLTLGALPPAFQAFFRNNPVVLHMEDPDLFDGQPPEIIFPSLEFPSCEQQQQLLAEALDVLGDIMPVFVQAQTAAQTQASNVQLGVGGTSQGITSGSAAWATQLQSSVGAATPGSDISVLEAANPGLSLCLRPGLDGAFELQLAYTPPPLVLSLLSTGTDAELLADGGGSLGFTFDGSAASTFRLQVVVNGTNDVRIAASGRIAISLAASVDTGPPLELHGEASLRNAYVDIVFHGGGALVDLLSFQAHGAGVTVSVHGGDLAGLLTIEAPGFPSFLPRPHLVVTAEDVFDGVGQLHFQLDGDISGLKDFFLNALRSLARMRFAFPSSSRVDMASNSMASEQASLFETLAANAERYFNNFTIDETVPLRRRRDSDPARVPTLRGLADVITNTFEEIRERGNDALARLLHALKAAVLRQADKLGLELEFDLRLHIDSDQGVSTWFNVFGEVADNNVTYQHAPIDPNTDPELAGLVTIDAHLYVKISMAMDTSAIDFGNISSMACALKVEIHPGSGLSGVVHIGPITGQWGPVGLDGAEATGRFSVRLVNGGGLRSVCQIAQPHFFDQLEFDIQGSVLALVPVSLPIATIILRVEVTELFSGNPRPDADVDIDLVDFLDSPIGHTLEDLLTQLENFLQDVSQTEVAPPSRRRARRAGESGNIFGGLQTQQLLPALRLYVKLYRALKAPPQDRWLQLSYVLFELLPSNITDLFTNPPQLPSGFPAQLPRHLVSNEPFDPNQFINEILAAFGTDLERLLGQSPLAQQAADALAEAVGGFNGLDFQPPSPTTASGALSDGALDWTRPNIEQLLRVVLPPRAMLAAFMAFWRRISGTESPALGVTAELAKGLVVSAFYDSAAQAMRFGVRFDVDTNLVSEGEVTGLSDMLSNALQAVDDDPTSGAEWGTLSGDLGGNPVGLLVRTTARVEVLASVNISNGNLRIELATFAAGLLAAVENLGIEAGGFGVSVSGVMDLKLGNSTSGSLGLVLLDTAGGHVTLPQIADIFSPRGSLSLTFLGSVGAAIGAFALVRDENVFDAVPPSVTWDLLLLENILQPLASFVSDLDDVGREINEAAALNRHIPLLNRTVHELLFDRVGAVPAEQQVRFGEYLRWEDTLRAVVEAEGCTYEALTGCAVPFSKLLVAVRARLDEIGRIMSERNTQPGVPIRLILDVVPQPGSHLQLTLRVAVAVELNIQVDAPWTYLFEVPYVNLQLADAFLAVRVPVTLDFEVVVHTAGLAQSSVTLHELSIGAIIDAEIDVLFNVLLLQGRARGSGHLDVLVRVQNAVVGSPDPVDFELQGNIEAEAEFDVSVLGVSILEDGARPSVRVVGTDLFGESELSVTTHGLDRMLSFRAMSTDTILALIDALEDFLQRYRDTEAFKKKLPLLDISLNDVLDFASSFKEAIIDELTVPLPPAQRPSLELVLQGNCVDDLEQELNATVLTLVLNDDQRFELDLTADIDALLDLEDDPEAIATLVNTRLQEAHLDDIFALRVAPPDAASRRAPRGRGGRADPRNCTSFQLYTVAAIEAVDFVLELDGADVTDAQRNATRFLGLRHSLANHVQRYVRAPTFEDFFAAIERVLDLPPGFTNGLYELDEARGEYRLQMDLRFRKTMRPPAATLDFSAGLGPLLSASAQASLQAGLECEVSLSLGAFLRTNPRELIFVGILPLPLRAPNTTVLSPDVPSSYYQLPQAVTFHLTIESADAGGLVTHSVTVPATTANEPDRFLDDLRAALVVGGVDGFIRLYDNLNGYVLVVRNSKKCTLVFDNNEHELLGFGTVLEATAISITPFFDHLRVRLGGEIELSIDELLARAGPLTVAAYRGLARIGVEGELSITNPRGGPLTLAVVQEIMRNGSTNELFQALGGSLALTASLDLPEIRFSVPGLVNEVGRLTLNLRDATMSFQGGTVHVGAFQFDFDSNLDELFSRLLSFEDFDIFAAIRALILALVGDPDDPASPGLLGAGLMSKKLPFVDQTPKELAGSVLDVLDVVEQVLSGGEGLENLNQQLALYQTCTPALCASIGVSFTTWPGGIGQVIELDLMLTLQYETSAQLNFDLASLLHSANVPADITELITSFVDVEGSLQLLFSVSGSFRLRLGLTVPTSLGSGQRPRLLVHPSTALRIELLASVRDINMVGSLGPISVEVNGGELTLGAPGLTPGMEPDPAALVLGLSGSGFNPVDLTAPNGFNTLAQRLSFTVDASVLLYLPIAAPLFDITGQLYMSIPSLRALLDNQPNAVQLDNQLSGGSLDTLTRLKNILAGFTNPLTALLQDPRQLLTALDQILGAIEKMMSKSSGALGKVKLPLVGKRLMQAFKSGANFIQAFRQNVIARLQAALKRSNNLAGIICDQLNDLFSGLGLLRQACVVRRLDENGNELPAGGTDLEAFANLDAVEWRMTIGSNFTLLDINSDLDLGLDGFPLTFTLLTQLKLLIGWSISLNIGWSAKDGFFIGTNGPNTPQMSVHAQLLVPTFDAVGTIFFLAAQIERLPGFSAIPLVEAAVSLYLRPSPANVPKRRLTMADFKTKGLSALELVVEASVQADLGLTLGIASGGDVSAGWPSLYGEFHAAWGLRASTATGFTSDTPSIYFSQFSLDVGTTLKQVLGPIMEKLADVTDPVRTILEPLMEPIPGLSDLMGRDINVLEILQVLGGDETTAEEKAQTRKYIEMIFKLVELANMLRNLGQGRIPLAGQACAGSLEHRWGLFEPSPGAGLEWGSHCVDENGNIITRRRRDDHVPEVECAFGDVCQSLREIGVRIPLLESPFNAFQLIQGKDIDLVQYFSPTLTVRGGFEFAITVYTPPTIEIVIVATLALKAQIKIGYDTNGIRRAIEQKQPLLAFDGFYILTKWEGKPDAQLSLTGGIRLALQLSLGPLKVGVFGGIILQVDLSLRDVGENDDKLRPSEIITLFSMGLSAIKYLFRIDVRLFVEFGFYVKIDLWLFEISFEKSWTFEVMHWVLEEESPLRLGRVGNDKTLTLSMEAAKAWRTLQSSSEPLILKVAGANGGRGNEEVGVSMLASQSLSATVAEYSFPGVARVAASTADLGDAADFILVIGNLASDMNVEGPASARYRQLELRFDSGKSVRIEAQGDLLTVTDLFSNAVVRVRHFDRLLVTGSADDDHVMLVGDFAAFTHVTINLGAGADELELADLDPLTGCDIDVDMEDGIDVLLVSLTKWSAPAHVVIKSDRVELPGGAYDVMIDHLAVVEITAPAASGGVRHTVELESLPVHQNASATIDSLGSADIIVADTRIVNVRLTLGLVPGDTLTLQAGSNSGGVTCRLEPGLLRLCGLPLGELAIGALSRLTVKGTSSADTFVINGTSAPLSQLLGGGGGDTFNVLSVDRGTTLWIDGEAGADSVTVTNFDTVPGPAAGNHTMNGPVHVVCGGASDTVAVLLSGRGAADVTTTQCAVTVSAATWSAQNNFHVYTMERQVQDRVPINRLTGVECHATSVDTESSARGLAESVYTDLTLVVNGHTANPDAFSVYDANVPVTLNGLGGADDLQVGVKVLPPFLTTRAKTSVRSAGAFATVGRILGNTRLRTVEVTRGNTAALTFNGGAGNDAVLINKHLGPITLAGSSGRDTFADSMHYSDNEAARNVVWTQAYREAQSRNRVDYSSFEDIFVVFNTTHPGQPMALIDVLSTTPGATTSMRAGGRREVRVKCIGVQGTVTMLGGALASSDPLSDLLHLHMTGHVGATTGSFVESPRSSRLDELAFFGLNMPAGVLYAQYFGETLVELTNSDDTFTIDVHAAAPQLKTTVDAHSGADTVYVDRTPFVSLSTTVLGGDGIDQLLVRSGVGVGEHAENRLHGLITIDSQRGEDIITVLWAGTGDSNIAVFDSSRAEPGAVAEDRLLVFGTAAADQILLRLSRMLCIHNATREQIVFDPEAVITAELDAEGGDDFVAVDSTNAFINVRGGEGDDKFVIGQLFNSKRDALAGLTPLEAQSVLVARTTRGFLSRGNLQPMTIEGGDGDDRFYVQHNSKTLALFGQAGNDFFSVRSFLLQPEPMLNVDPEAFAREDVAIKGHDDDDAIQYDLNAPVIIDGGSGFNTLVVIGTEIDDVYVIHKSGIYGAGRFIKAINIQRLVVAAEEGNDIIYVQSTSPYWASAVMPGLGSDTVHITHAEPAPVIARTLRGHTGVVALTVEDPPVGDWEHVPRDGIMVQVVDNDQPGGSITVKRQQLELLGNTIVFPNVAYPGIVPDTHDRLSYQVRLSKQPSTNINIQVVLPTLPPEPGDTEVNTYLRSQIDGQDTTEMVFSPANWSLPRTVQLLPDTEPEEPLDPQMPGEQMVVVFHKFFAPGSQQPDEYMLHDTELEAMTVRLLYVSQPGVYVMHKHRELTLTEGSNDFATYELAAYPCRPETLVHVSLRADAPGLIIVPDDQVELHHSKDCRDIVLVRAVNDAIPQGTHMSVIHHNITFTTEAVHANVSIDYVAVKVGR